jgi:hypothetical protein
MRHGGCDMVVPGRQNSSGVFQSTLYDASVDSRQLEMHERAYRASPREHSIL